MSIFVESMLISEGGGVSLNLSDVYLISNVIQESSCNSVVSRRCEVDL